MKDYNIGYLIKKIDDKFEYELNLRLSRFDLTIAQLRVLKAVLVANEANQEILQKDIERELRLSNPTVTGIIKRLEAKDYIYKEASLTDRRSHLLHATKKACDLDKIVKNTIDENEQKLLSCLEPEERDILKKYLLKIFLKLENKYDQNHN